MKKFFFLFAVAQFAIAGCSKPECGTYIPIKDTVEDDEFWNYLLKNFDIDGNGDISEEEAALVTKIDVSGNRDNKIFTGEIKSLAGIEWFKNLEYLDCSCNQLTSLDVSKNTALAGLDCSSNQLTSLDVSKNTVLTWLLCSSNQLTSLDVSKNTALAVLDCSSNQLTSLDVSKNTALAVLLCSSNQLTSLDVSKNTALTMLDCRYNQLTSLDVSNNTALTYLECDDNLLETLYLKTGMSISGITDDRSSYYIPSRTEIIFVD